MLGQGFSLGDRLLVFHQNSVVPGDRILVGKDFVLHYIEYTDAVLLLQIDPPIDVRDDRFTLGDTSFEKLLHARQTMGDVRGTRHTTGVEGSQGELRARLTDRLRSNDAHCLANLDQPAARQIPAVAHGAQAVAKSTGQGRADVHLGDLEILDHLCVFFINHLIRGEDNLSGLGIDHRSDGHPTQEALGHRLAHGLGFGQGQPDSGLGTTVHTVDYYILGDVHQAPGQITGVGRSQGRVGQTFARAVGGDKVLQGGQSLAEVGADRQGDDPACRVGHQATHTGQLANGRKAPLGCP